MRSENILRNLGRCLRADAGIVSISGRKLFILFGLLFSLSPAFTPGQTPQFWEIGLTIHVEGNYFCRQNGQQLEGIFRGSFCWEGLMEPDEPDVIIYHWRKDVLSWEAKEREPEDHVDSGFRSIASNPPGFTVSAFLRHGDSFELHFFIESLAIPLSSFQPKYQLLLPASFGQNLRREGIGYNEHVCQGSNRVAVAAKELLAPETKQSITWSWRFPPAHLSDKSPEFRTEHQVKVELVIKRHLKGGG